MDIALSLGSSVFFCASSNVVDRLGEKERVCFLLLYLIFIMCLVSLHVFVSRINDAKFAFALIFFCDSWSYFFWFYGDLN